MSLSAESTLIVTQERQGGCLRFISSSSPENYPFKYGLYVRPKQCIFHECSDFKKD